MAQNSRVDKIPDIEYRVGQVHPTNHPSAVCQSDLDTGGR